MGSIEEQALAAARAVALEHGVPCERAEVINSASNVLVGLRPSPVVARVMTGTVVLHEDPERWLADEVAVLEFLAPSGLAVAPSPLIDPGPHRRDGLWMTFCEAVEIRGRAGLDDPERLGLAIRDLHAELAGFAGELPGLADLQQDIERLLRLLRPNADLSAERIGSLEARLHALTETVFHSPLPTQPLHGDASLSNLLRTGSGRLLWNDFEDTFRGPVHWDLAGYVMDLEAQGGAELAARALDAYGGIERQELETFAAAHDVYGEIWGLHVDQRRAT